jgi:hypothetical protein
MNWRDLLATDSSEERVLPWVGGRTLHGADRSWQIKGRLPREFGWYTFKTPTGRHATLMGREEAEPDPDYEEGRKTMTGYVAGGRMIPDDARVDPDPAKLAEQTEPVYLVERGLDRFTRAVAAWDGEGRLIYVRQEFPQGPEQEVLDAFLDRAPDIHSIPNVTPALDAAFRWETFEREAAEERERERLRLLEEERKRLEAEERRAALVEQMGDAAGRRAMARQDFGEAARSALALSGAELLDHREGYNQGEMLVRYLFRGRRLECACSKYTLRIIDAGVCLDDHMGTKGDTYFTLESLPGVIGQAIDEGVLVQWDVRGRG